MEVQSPQSVQINFNNKIITLHNVTIVKNPKIITIDATQYSNFLKGSPVKLNNATNSTTPGKFQLPPLTPVKSTQLLTGNISLKTSPTFKPFVLNQTSGVTQVPKLTSPTQVIQTFQQKNGVFHLKSSPNVITSVTNADPIKLQSFLKQQPQQQTVIISPPKTPINTSPVKVQLKQGSAQTFVVAKSPTQANSTVSTVVKPEQTKLVVSPPQKNKTQVNSTVSTVKPEQTKVIISPPQKNKTSPCEISPPNAKRPCYKFDFHCIFCKNVYDDSTLLVEHLKLEHPQSVKDEPNKKEAATLSKKETPKEIEKPKEIEVEKEKEAPATVETLTPKTIEKPPQIESRISENEDESDGGDDDESEVNDLIMDLEETQDTVTSSQARSDTPESPEFEQHVPNITVKKEVEEPADEPMEEASSSSNDLDYDDYEYFSNIMEPICELSCEDDSNDHCVQDENEAMRLYREAMEVNYQQNGIKKRGRRRQRKQKTLLEHTTSINGILAGLLENTSPSVKVPPGPGRGRRKEMNVQELEIDRSNGVCLFSCNKCDASFKYAGDLAKHVRSHTISSPYQCSICQRKFTHIGSLNTHLRIHSGERPYKCNQCDKSFTQSNSLMVHVKSHLSNKPFQCLQCNKGFLNASSLALHTKTHTGPTTVFCPIDSCGKEFRDNNLLEEHMMTHRGSMLYQCSLCSEKFEQSCLLVQHVKSHIGDKPFQCNQCGKCFTQPGSLNTHLRIHTGEKPFECSICAKKFTQASSLSVHMKVHGEKEFKCVIESCSKSYSQEAYLKKHMMKHIEASLNEENNHVAQE